MLAFAHDIIILTEKKEELQELMEIFIKEIQSGAKNKKKRLNLCIFTEQQMMK